MPNYTREARRLWTSPAQGAGAVTTLIASGNSGSALIDLRLVQDVALYVDITTAPGGTTPTLVVGLDVEDPFGNFIAQVVKTASLNAQGVAAPVYGGLHTSPGLVLPEYGRISWTLGGTNPVFTTQITLMGR